MSGYRDDSPHGGLIPTHELQRRNAEVAYEEKITRLRAEVERLRAALREAFEVYAGSDGFIPETALEGYQQQIIKQMVQIISAALEEKK